MSTAKKSAPMSQQSIALASDCIQKAEPLLDLIIDDNEKKLGLLRYPKSIKTVGQALDLLQPLLENTNEACNELRDDLAALKSDKSGSTNSENRLPHDSEEAMLITMIVHALPIVKAEIDLLESTADADAKLKVREFPRDTKDNKHFKRIVKKVRQHNGEEVSVTGASMNATATTSDAAATTDDATATTSSNATGDKTASADADTETQQDTAEDSIIDKPDVAKLEVDKVVEESEENKDSDSVDSEAEQNAESEATNSDKTDSYQTSDKEDANDDVNDEVDASTDETLTASTASKSAAEIIAEASDALEQSLSSLPTAQDDAKQLADLIDKVLSMSSSELRKHYKDKVRTHAQKDQFFAALLSKIESLESVDSAQNNELAESAEEQVFKIQDMSSFTKQVEGKPHVLVKWQDEEELTWEPKEQQQTKRSQLPGGFFKPGDTSFKKFNERFAQIGQKVLDAAVDRPNVNKADKASATQDATDKASATQDATEEASATEDASATQDAAEEESATQVSSEETQDDAAAEEASTTQDASAEASTTQDASAEQSTTQDASVEASTTEDESEEASTTKDVAEEASVSQSVPRSTDVSQNASKRSKNRPEEESLDQTEDVSAESELTTSSAADFVVQDDEVSESFTVSEDATETTQETLTATTDSKKSQDASMSGADFVANLQERAAKLLGDKL